MQDCNDLMSALQLRGVRLWTEDGQLHFRAAKGALSQQDIDTLRARRAAIIEALEAAELMQGIPTTRRPALQEPVPLTALQMRRWKYISEQSAGLSERTCIVAQHVLGPLDVDTLQASLQRIVRRHEALRSKIVLVGGVAMQCVDDDLRCELLLVDLENVPANDPKKVARLCEELVKEKVDLCAGPLVAAKVFRVSAHEHVLVIVAEHMISDAVSCEIMAKEMWAAYHQTVQGRQCVLPEVAVQFPDYVLWQHRTHRAWLAKHEDYWRKRVAGVACDKLPIDRTAREREPPVAEIVSFSLGEAVTARLRILARRERSLLSLLVLALYSAALARWLSQRDLLLAFVSNARDRPELQGVVGFLADYLHLRIEVDEEECFIDLLSRLTREFRSAYEHQDYGRVPDLIPQCLPELGFNWIPKAETRESFGPKSAADALEVRPFPLQLAFPLPRPRKMSTLFRDTDAAVMGAVAYRPDLLAADAVEQFVHSLRCFARQVSQRPHVPLASIDSVGALGSEQ